jgi:hypothetical protein
VTNEEMIASFMEPRPGLPLAYSHHLVSLKRWWILVPINGGGMSWIANGLSLDRLREVESRLTEEQVGHYDRLLDMATKLGAHGNDNPAAATVFPWHASAEQKIAALASVLPQPPAEVGKERV